MTDKIDVNIRLAAFDDQQALMGLVAEFRQSLARLRGREREIDLDAGASELACYQVKDYPVYLAEVDEDKVVGYLVCRVDDDVVMGLLRNDPLSRSFVNSGQADS